MIERRRIGDGQHRADIAAPDDAVGIDQPLVRHLSNRREDRVRIELLLNDHDDSNSADVPPSWIESAQSG